jgi:diguanylate cyclase (GGDEF)-like protein
MLNRELKRRIYELHNLFQISLDLTAILDLDQLINSYLNTIIGQLRIKNAILYLNKDRNSTELVLNKTKGIEEEEIDKLKFETTDAIVKQVFKKRQPVVIAEELTSLKEIEKFRMMDSEVITPLIHSHRLEGLLILGTKINGEPYTQTDLEMLTLITNIVAVAIANARLYQKLKDISITDELTAIYNYRYFRIRLKDEVFRSQRTGRPITLVILDVDHFKNYNDSLGHPAGDQVLKQIARILKMCARDSDVVARYGGEEFCVILPEVDIQGSRAFCERLRQNVEDYPFFNEEIQPYKKLTISLGAATYPHDAKMINELLVRADNALYRAKNSGRNQFHVYSEEK